MRKAQSPTRYSNKCWALEACTWEHKQNRRRKGHYNRPDPRHSLREHRGPHNGRPGRNEKGNITGIVPENTAVGGTVAKVAVAIKTASSEKTPTQVSWALDKILTQVLSPRFIWAQGESNYDRRNYRRWAFYKFWERGPIHGSIRWIVCHKETI